MITTFMVRATKKFSVIERVEASSAKLFTASEYFAALQLDSDRAKAISLQERQNIMGSKWVSDVPLTYGEVTFDSLHHIFRKMRDLGILPHFNFGALDTSELSFYDLGHGAGRPCLAAACLYPFRNVVGIELLEGLYQQSLKSKEAWEMLKLSQHKIWGIESCKTVSIGALPKETALMAREGKDGVHQSEMMPTIFNSKTKIDFFCGSFLDLQHHDWTDGDVIFANSVCYSPSMMYKLAEMGHRLKSGAVFITSNARLSGNGYKLLSTLRLPTSWGEADFHIQLRI